MRYACSVPNHELGLCCSKQVRREDNRRTPITLKRRRPCPLRPNSRRPTPTRRKPSEWLEALQAVIAQEGPERAHFLLEQLIALGHQTGINMPYSATTEYINTIPADQQPVTPGDYEMEQKIRSYVRWNAMAMVLRANKDDSGLGGHIASFASAATLYDIGFNHFWHAPSEKHGGDLVLSRATRRPASMRAPSCSAA
jgi:pyruvate dehydrogenase complex dehydrogenase (E1) component